MFVRNFTGSDNGKNAQCRRSVTPVSPFLGQAKEDNKAKEKPLQQWSAFASRMFLQSHHCSVLHVFSIGIKMYSCED